MKEVKASATTSKCQKIAVIFRLRVLIVSIVVTRAAEGSIKKRDTLIDPRTHRDSNNAGGNFNEGTYRTQPGDDVLTKVKIFNVDYIKRTKQGELSMKMRIRIV